MSQATARPLKEITSDLELFEKRRLHAANKIRWHVPPELRGRFLDIGCGTGNGLVAALQEGFTLAAGIDRDLGEFTWYNVDDFDSICSRYDVDASKALLIGADIFQTAFPRESFDCVFLLDSIEHVPNPRAFIEVAAQYVSPNGVLLIDTCPLYYSKVGAHLWPFFPPDEYPWVHLRYDFKDLVERHPVNPWHWTRFEELSRVTHNDIRRTMEECGLTIIQEHRSTPTQADLELLEKHRSSLNLEGIDETLLFEDWVLLVGRRLK